MSWKPEPSEVEAMIRFEGIPYEPSREGEQTLWRRFVQFISPWARKTGWASKQATSMVQDFAVAELSKRQGEAAKYAAEASEIAAQRDERIQTTVKVVNDEIARIFSRVDLPDIAIKRQLANLLAANPQIGEQLAKIERLYAPLHSRHGTRLELVDNQAIGEQCTDNETPPRAVNDN